MSQKAIPPLHAVILLGLALGLLALSWWLFLAPRPLDYGPGPAPVSGADSREALLEKMRGGMDELKRKPKPARENR